MRFPNPLKRSKVRIRRPRIRIRWRKNSSWWAVGVAVAFFASLFALHVVLMQHAESILRNVLDSRVRQATEGFYSTSFDQIEVGYTDRSFIIHNLRLYPDSSRMVDQQGRSITPAKVYDILIPQLRIEGINLRQAYLDKSLIVRALRVVRPDIQLYINLDLSPTASDSLKTDINERLAPFFKSIRAKKLAIKEGKLDLHLVQNKQHSNLKTTLDFEASELQVTTALRPEDVDWIQVNRFLVQLGPVAGYVANQTYLVRLKSMTASSADSSFFMQGFQLLPTAAANTLAQAKPALERLYTIRVPQLYSYGIDYSALYNKSIFNADEITLLSPAMELLSFKPQEKGKKENFKPEDLYASIENILKEVQVNRLYIRHGKTVVKNREEQSLTNLRVNIRTASVFNFLLDSAAHSRSDKLFFADSVQVSLYNYQLRLSDQLHLLKADELMLNSHTKRVQAENLRIEPDSLQPLRKNSPSLYKASVPRLEIAGFNLLQLYNHNRLLIDSLLVENPVFGYTRQISRTEQEPSTKKAFQQDDLYGLISDYLYQLQINKLLITGGTVSVSKDLQDSLEVFNTRIDHAYLWNLQIDSASAYQLNKLFYAQNFDVQIADYRHTLPDGVHAIEAKAISVSTIKDQILLKGVRVYNKPGYTYPFSSVQINKVPTLLNIEVPTLELNGVDILKSYLNKRLQVSEVVIPSPLVHVGVRLTASQKRDPGIIQSAALYSLIEDFTEAIVVDRLRITDAQILTAFYTPNGLLQLNSTDASVAIENFRFDAFTSRNPKRLFFADAVTVSAREFLADLPDERYQIKADLVQASTATQSILAEGVVLQQPEQQLSERELELKGKKGILSFVLPSVRITGVDFDNGYYQEQLHLDSIVAIAPALRYQNIGSTTDKAKKPKLVLPQTTLFQYISPFFRRLSVGTVMLENGSLEAVRMAENRDLQQNLFLDKISIAVTDFAVDSAAVNNTQRFFYSKDIRVHIGEYRWKLPDKEHQLTASNLDLSTSSNLIRASSVELKPLAGLSRGGLTSDRYFIKVPEVVLIGIPFDDIYEKEEFRLKKLELINPDIEIRQYPSPAGKKPKQSRSLPERLSAGLSLLKIEEAQISGGSFQYVSYGNEKPVNVVVPELEATLTNFEITPNTTAKAAKPFFSDNLEVRIGNWKRLLPDSLHWLEVQNIVFSAKDSLLLAEQLRVYPQSEVLSAANPTLIHAEVPSVRLEGFAYGKLEHDSLIAQQLRIRQPRVDILQSSLIQKNSETSAPSANTAAMLKLIQVDSVLLTEGTFVMREAKAADTSRLELNHVYVTASGFLYDSLQQQQQNRILFTDNLVAGVKDYKAFTSDSLYEIEAKDISLSTGTSQLWADSLRITPTLNKAAFAKAKGYETDQYIIRNRRLQFDSLDMHKLFYDKTLEADRLLIDGLSLHLYRDKRQPFPENHFPTMPQELLRNSSWDIMIRETILKDGYVAYAEQVKGARQEGFIDLTNFQMHADTISNRKHLLDSGYVTNIEASFLLMGVGKLSANFEIPIGDTLNRHVLYGTLEEMELSEFNPILEKTAFISIRSGQAEQIDFRVVADRNKALGTMEFIYDDLRVALVNKRTGKPGGLFRELASVVANVFVKSSNTLEDGNGSLRLGEIRYQRDEHRSMVNYWVKTLIAGFKSSIGI